MDALLSEMDAAPGDFILFSADKLATVRKVPRRSAAEAGGSPESPPEDELNILLCDRLPPVRVLRGGGAAGYRHASPLYHALSRGCTVSSRQTPDGFGRRPSTWCSMALSWAAALSVSTSGKCRTRCLRRWASLRSRSMSALDLWSMPSAMARRPMRALPLALTGL